MSPYRACRFTLSIINHGLRSAQPMPEHLGHAPRELPGSRRSPDVGCAMQADTAAAMCAITWAARKLFASALKRSGRP
jgi:hypothetical protein